jgi:hypothetical protein
VIRGPGQPGERADEIGLESGEGAVETGVPADEDMVGTGLAGVCEGEADDLAQAALQAVAGDRVADLLGDSEAGAHGGIIVAAGADEKDEAGGDDAGTAICGKEISAAAYGGRRAGHDRPRNAWLYARLRR